MSSLESQLAKIFKAGLTADPKSARTLASALTQHADTHSNGKSTKAEANYQTSSGYGSKAGKECGGCDNFDGQSGCEVVSGHVAADGTCDYWTGSSSDSEPDPGDTTDPESQVDESA